MLGIKIKKLVKYVALLSVIALALVFVNQVLAATVDLGLNFAEGTGLGTTDIRITIAKIIRIFFGLLGIIAVLLILYGGYLYMVSQGDKEKTLQARKLMISAAIGLVIILSAFAITQFILTSLTDAISGTGGTDTGTDDGVCQECDFLAGCPDPDATLPAPYICKISPTQGPVGTFVTIRGGKFGSYNNTSSKVTFFDGQTEVQAEIASCNGSPAWGNNRIVVEVPAGLTTERNPFDIYVVTANGSSSTKVTTPISIGTPNNQFNVTAGVPGPGIACVVPDEGKENDAVIAYGKRFGDTQGTSQLIFNENKNAAVTSWQKEKIEAKVASGAISGDIVAQVNNVSSNGFPFYVRCDNNTQCASACCYLSKYCAIADMCLPGVGEKCKGATVSCTAGQCRSGLECRADLNCTCQQTTKPGLGQSCDPNPNTPACEVGGECADGLYCRPSDCKCQSLPVIEFVDPDNGTTGNFITIFGIGFGTAKGQIYFMGSTDDNGDDKLASLPAVCDAATSWTDKQVIVEVPADAKTGPIKIVTADNLVDDTTRDTFGYQMTFSVNQIKRPGICNVSPSTGPYNTIITLSGINFGTTKTAADSVYFSAVEGGNKGNWSWDYAEISSVATPNLQPDNVKVQVKVGSELSNPVTYIIEATPDAPFIDYIDPASGPAGQYLTIWGKNFGQYKDLAKVTFIDPVSKDKISDPNLVFDFPKECGDPAWYSKSIIVKVPAGINLGATQIYVTSSAGLDSNQKDFNICDKAAANCPLTPGICKITPTNGPAATPGLEIIGEKFGIFDATKSKVIFWQDQLAQDVATNWTDKKIGSKDGLVVQVPADAKTGPLYITDSTGTKSNSVNFTVQNCLKVAASVPNRGCETGTTCCELDGICKQASLCKITQAPLAAYEWNFYTGEILPGPGMPQVVEDVLCAENTQSPSPFLNSDSNCKNAEISARFTTKMDTAAFVTRNIVVSNCGTGPKFDDTKCVATGWTATPIQKFEYLYNYANNTYPANGFILTPPSALAVNNWYKVELVSGASGLRSDSGIWLDGDFDNYAGGNYNWHFKTRDSNEACQLSKVTVTPGEAKMTGLDQTQEYNALALAANCNLLNAGLYDWQWTSLKSDGTSGVNIATITNNKDKWPPLFDGPPDYTIIGYGDDKVDPQQIATPTGQGVTYIGATPYEGTKKLNVYDTNNKLEVDLNEPIITEIYPKDGLVNAQVNTAITIKGKNFGDIQGASQLYIGGAPADLVTCGIPWSDSQIMAYVPKPKTLVSENYQAFGSPATINPADSSILLYYKFDENSKALAADASKSKIDGEITNGDKAAGKLGQALSLSGNNSYLRIPTKFDLTEGSISLWFKLNEINREQAIFSVAEGNNLKRSFEIFVGAGNNLRARLSDLDWSDKWDLARAGTKANVWYAVTVTVGNGFVKLYVNGYLVAVKPATNFLDLIANQNNVLIGAIKTGTNYVSLLNGQVDDLVIYNRVLSSEEIQQNYGINQLGGQVGLWNFEENGSTAYDQSGNNNSGYLNSNSGELPKRVDGKFGKALSLTGDDYVKINNSDNFHFTNQITALAWYKPVNTTAVQTLIGSQYGGGFSLGIKGFTLVLLHPDGTIGNNFASSGTGTGLVNNQWNFVAGTYDGNDIKFYINGKLANDYTVIGEIVTSDIERSVCLGANALANGSCGNAFFTGDLDEVAVYNRALDASEISKLYGASFPAEVKVITTGGSAVSTDKFTQSENIYPFLCSLDPNFGSKDTAVALGGENFGDSNFIEINGQKYQIGSYAKVGDLFLGDKNLRAWSNALINITNPKRPEEGSVFAIRVRIDTNVGPYKDNNNNGIYDSGDTLPANYSATTPKPLDSNTQDFYMAPVITSINPPAGPVKQWVTLMGYNFGTEPGTVYFFDGQTAEITPCATYWQDRQIIVAVPANAISGDVYVVTKQLIPSNNVKFTVNNDPLGAGICSVVNNNPTSAYYNDYVGIIGDPVLVTGSRFNVRNGDNDNLIFTKPKENKAGITDWNNAVTSPNQNIRAIVPIGTESGLVKIVQKLEIGKTCAGFAIGSFCPSNKYNIDYKDIPSNSVRFDIPGQTSECSSDADCPCGEGYSRCDLVTRSCMPKITNFTGTSGPVGSWVTLYGCYFGCSRGSVFFTDEKRALDIANADCGETWRCSVNSQEDEVVVEVPNLTTTETTDDAVDGPLRLVTARNLSDDTSDLNPSDFDVNNIPQPNLCRLAPNYGKTTSGVDLFGKQFEETRGTNDYVQFYLDKKLADTDYRNIPTDTACTGDGWSDGKICGTVPVGSTTGLVRVINNGIASNGIRYKVVTQCTTGQAECGASCCGAGSSCAERLVPGKALAFTGVPADTYACSKDTSIACNPTLDIGADCTVGSYRCALDVTKSCSPEGDAGGCGPDVNRCSGDQSRTCTNVGQVSTNCSGNACDKHLDKSCTVLNEAGCDTKWVCTGSGTDGTKTCPANSNNGQVFNAGCNKLACQSNGALSCSVENKIYSNCNQLRCNGDPALPICTKANVKSENCTGYVCNNDNSLTCDPAHEAAGACNVAKCSIGGASCTIGKSLYFNGTNLYGKRDSPLIYNKANWTMTMWVKPENTGSDMVVYSEGALGYSGTDSVSYIKINADGTVTAYLYTKTVGAITLNQSITSDSKINFGQWNFIAVGLSGGDVSVYYSRYNGILHVNVNGVNKDGVNAGYLKDGWWTKIYNSVYFGMRMNVTPALWYKGELDEFHFYGQYKDQAFLTTEYGGGLGRYCLTSDVANYGLQACFHFNEGTGKKIISFTDYTLNNIVLNNTTTWPNYGAVRDPGICGGAGDCLFDACTCTTGCIQKPCECAEGVTCQAVSCDCPSGDKCIKRTCDCDGGQVCSGQTCACPLGDTCIAKTCECTEGQSCDNKPCQCPGTGNSCKLTPCQCPGTDNRCVKQEFDLPCEGGATCVSYNLAGSPEVKALSLETWFKTTSNGTIVALNTGNDLGPALGIKDNKLSAIIADKGSIKAQVSADDIVNNSIWHLGVMTFDGQKVRLYLDGVEKKSADLVYTMANTANNGMIGSGTKSKSHFGRYNGSMDEVRIYNRALTTAEIVAHYNSGNGVSGQTETGLIAGWHLDETSGKTYKDYSGNNNNATAQNSGPSIVSGKVGYMSLGCVGMDCAIFCTGNNMCCSQACVDGVCPDAVGLGPRIESTVPNDSSGEFCRNGIVTVNFDKKISAASIKDNINIYDCGQRAATSAYLDNSIGRTFARMIDAIWKGVRIQYGLAETCTKIEVVTQDKTVANKSQVSVAPAANVLLNINSNYKLEIKGGTSGIKDLEGHQLVGKVEGLGYISNDGDNYNYYFVTGGNANDLQSGICSVENIKITLYNSSGSSGQVVGQVDNGITITSDTFACAANGCLDDQDTAKSGNQHYYVAQAMSGVQEIKATYKWERTDAIDPQRILEIYNTVDSFDSADAVGTTDLSIDSGVYATIAPVQKASAKLSIEAKAIAGDMKQQSLDVLAFLCQNPWPALGTSFPNYYDLNPYNFELIYCRDKGSENTPVDDLPGAGVIKVK